MSKPEERLLRSWLPLVAAAGLPSAAVAAILSGDSDLTLRAYRLFFDWATSRSFEGRTVWITGASSGIGEACALEFARRGARVVLSARRLDQLQDVAKRCRNPEMHLCVQLDLQDLPSHESVAKEVIRKVGAVDVLLNCAGRSQRSLVESTSMKVFEDIMHLNTLGTISFTKAVYNHMRPGAEILAVSSLAGKLGSPGAAAYSASKFALHGFFEAFRIEAKVHRGVHVGMICPGPTVSNGAENAMTGDGGVAHQDPDTPASSYDKRRMKTERCAELIACMARFRLPECWISPQPELIITYIAQYAPAIYAWLACKLGPSRIRKYKRTAAL